MIKEILHPSAFCSFYLCAHVQCMQLDKFTLFAFTHTHTLSLTLSFTKVHPINWTVYRLAFSRFSPSPIQILLPIINRLVSLCLRDEEKIYSSLFVIKIDCVSLNEFCQTENAEYNSISSNKQVKKIKREKIDGLIMFTIKTKPRNRVLSNGNDWLNG